MRRLLLYPFAIGLFPVISLYAANTDNLHLSELWIPIGVVLGGLLVIGALFQLLLKRPRQAWRPHHSPSSSFSVTGTWRRLGGNNWRECAIRYRIS